MKLTSPLILGIIICVVTATAGGQTTVASINEESIKADMQLHVCKNGHRLEAVKALFRKKGASDDEIRIDALDGVENLVVEKKGKSDETIIVGAHYDKVSNGCGALDNWT